MSAKNTTDTGIETTRPGRHASAALDRQDSIDRQDNRAANDYAHSVHERRRANVRECRFFELPGRQNSQLKAAVP